MNGNHQTPLAEALHAKRMTNRDLAKALNIPEAQVSRYRNGLRPSKSRRVEIANVVGAKTKVLWPDA